jgi:RNA polymerase sigma-54 factor
MPTYKNEVLIQELPMVQLSQTMRLEQRLSPQQILLSTLLQLPLLSLEQKIQTEMELNPVLEEGIDDDLELTSEEIDVSSEEHDEVQKELELTENGSNDLDVSELKNAESDTDWETLLNDDDSYEIRIPRDKNEEEGDRPEVSVSTMTDYLLEQLNYLDIDEKSRSIGEYIIWNLRDDGYLDGGFSIESAAEILETTPQIVESVLKRIQVFDPVGIAARDLRECLLIQVQDREDQDEIALKIIRDHFEDFKNKRYDKLINDLEISRERLKTAITVISRLNPKPGMGIHDVKNNYIIPDFIVEKVEEEFVVTLNDWNIPPLRINKTYRQLLLDKKNTDRDTKQYIRKKMESAKWFINSIYQRKATMLKVMQAILEKQYDFFDKGPDHIKPLIMREIAEMIQMDISTVSRVANGKYVQTDYGVYELKYFFNERIETDEGEEISTIKIKNRIRDLIEKEGPRKTLSDEKLAQLLNVEGFPVARRTVAKYREQLGIPVARLRKKI